ncbi:hypothetical protein [Spiroplasma culicicola]|uniref:Uncharacterized protein n=1 Tax=Spiroplasma culicicola AES-1 TaxID=1276246 RepID=W6A792_9MOLU|nr:hypothetical protein [Spiroplasma culicicola]AHI52700.1 hypothetical protein SCULI_v1c03590 [Spiroplasma culicicola AES-1]
MKKTVFSPEDFKKFEDNKNIMMQIFGITCSVCGIDEIGYVAQNAPKTIGQIAQEAMEENPDITDEQLDELMEGPIGAWQEVDDYNASIGMPTFACDNCYQQLIDGEISISDASDQEEE